MLDISSTEVIFLFENNFSVSYIINSYYHKYKYIYTKKEIRERVEEILCNYLRYPF